MSQTKTIVALCRFGDEHGWGHLIRTSALMGEARSRGWRTELWTSSDIDSIPHEQKRAFDVQRRFKQYDPDAFNRLKAEALDVVFVDEMYLPDAFYSRVRAFADGLRRPAKLVAMDDMRERSMEAAHLVINPELGLREAAYRAERALLGEAYFFARKGFAAPRRPGWVSSRGRIPVLVMIGGTDPHGCSLDVLNALLEIGEREFAPVLISGDGRSEEALRAALSNFEESHFDSAIDSFEMAGWIGHCRFGIIGCGSSVFEFAVMKKPFVGLHVVDNQSLSARSVETRWGLPIVSREKGGFKKGVLAAAIRSLLGRLDGGESIAFGDVDLQGTCRVMDRVESML